MSGSKEAPFKLINLSSIFLVNLLFRLRISILKNIFHCRREAVDSSDIQSEKCYIDLLGMINTIGRLVNQVR